MRAAARCGVGGSGVSGQLETTEMKSKILMLGAALAAVLVSGCAYDGHRNRVAVGVGVGGPDYYDGYYDGFYGPFDDGYWGNDGFFYYSDSGHNWHRDDGHHFRHESGKGWARVHGRGHHRDH